MAEDHGDPALMAEKAAMFDSIVANYRDAVHLSCARSRRFHGTATLFCRRPDAAAGDGHRRRIWMG
ncbi:hypothetical protein M8494_10545 [Serratia ureilytica]